MKKRLLKKKLKKKAAEMHAKTGRTYIHRFNRNEIFTNRRGVIMEEEKAWFEANFY